MDENWLRVCSHFAFAAKRIGGEQEVEAEEAEAEATHTFKMEEAILGADNWKQTKSVLHVGK